MRQTLTHLIAGGACLVLLGGCGSSMNGTSSAGFSTDEDAYSPPARTVASGTNARSLAAGTELFEKRPGQLYGTSPFPPDKPSKSAAASRDASDDFDNLEIVSPDLRSKLSVLRVGSDRTDENLLSVFAGLKNKSARQLPLEVQTIYKDKSDRRLSDGKSSWVPITLKPHEETQYRSVAISTDATDFTVRVRPAISSP